MALELSELARKEIITSKSKIIDMRKALYDKLKRANKKAAGFPSSIGGVDTMFFDKKHTGPPAFEVVNLVVGVHLYLWWVARYGQERGGCYEREITVCPFLLTQAS